MEGGVPSKWRYDGGNLVLNSEFHRKPVQFFEQRCNMLSLRFPHDKSSSAVLDFLQACSLFGR